MKSFEDFYNENMAINIGSGAGTGSGSETETPIGSRGAGGKDGYGKKRKKKYLFQKRQIPEMLNKKTDNTISDEKLNKNIIG
jgi:hypothetical protein